MLCAALAGLAIQTASFGLDGVWRNYDEVFDLASDGTRAYAATNGGLLTLLTSVDPETGALDHWTRIPSPSGLRVIEQLDPLSVSTESGKILMRTGDLWHLGQTSTRQRDWQHGLLADPSSATATLPDDSVGPPPGALYSALSYDGAMLAGTSKGLFFRGKAGWKPIHLPTAMPVTRPTGIAKSGSTWIVGGIGGLFMGSPGKWTCICEDAIRQVKDSGVEVWVVHGNGAVDKLDPAQNRVYPDLLNGSAKRPWTSRVESDGKNLMFGGLGGWTERGAQQTERYPRELTGDVVTSIACRADVRWVGTQASGVLRFDRVGLKRFNPGTGLPDPWVTALCRRPEGLVVGTAHHGLFRIAGGGVSPLVSPTQRVSALATWQGRLVVGGMDGAWIQRGRTFTPLPTQGEETTSISQVGDRLAITTSAGVFFFR